MTHIPLTRAQAFEACRKVGPSGPDLLDLLAQDPEITKHVSRADLEKMVDPASYLGLAGEMVDRVLAIEDTYRRAAPA